MCVVAHLQGEGGRPGGPAAGVGVGADVAAGQKKSGDQLLVMELQGSATAGSTALVIEQQQLAPRML